MSEQELNPSRKLFRANPQTTVDVRTLYEALINVPIGEIISYATLSELIGRDVCSTNVRPLLQRARRMTTEQNQMVWDVKPKVGLLRCANNDILARGNRAIRHIRRTNTRMVKETVCMDLTVATPEQKRKMAGLQTLQAFLHEGTTQKTLKRIESACITNQALPLGKTLELFR